MYHRMHVEWIDATILDEASIFSLIGCRKRDSENKGNGGRGAQSQGRQNQGRGRFPGRGRGPQQGRGGFQGGLRQEQQHFHNGGFPGGPRPNGRGFNFNGGFGPMRPPFPEGTIIMPNFGLPFGSFPPQRLPPMVLSLFSACATSRGSDICKLDPFKALKLPVACQQTFAGMHLRDLSIAAGSSLRVKQVITKTEAVQGWYTIPLSVIIITTLATDAAL